MLSHTARKGWSRRDTTATVDDHFAASEMMLFSKVMRPLITLISVVAGMSNLGRFIL